MRQAFDPCKKMQTLDHSIKPTRRVSPAITSRTHSYNSAQSDEWRLPERNNGNRKIVMTNRRLLGGDRTRMPHKNSSENRQVKKKASNTYEKLITISVSTAISHLPYDRFAASGDLIKRNISILAKHAPFRLKKLQLPWPALRKAKTRTELICRRINTFMRCL